MWIMTDVGYLSIVEHQDDPGLLLVRARVGEDITSVFGDVEVEEKPGADYLYRAVLDRGFVANVLREKVMTLDYTSHAKDVAIQRSHTVAGRSSAYYATWTAMAKIQPYAPYATVPRSEQLLVQPEPSRWGPQDWPMGSR
jgi:hypothetical protein